MHGAGNVAAAQQDLAISLRPQSQPMWHRPVYSEKQCPDPAPATREIQIPRRRLPVHVLIPACAPSASAGIPTSGHLASAAAPSPGLLLAMKPPLHLSFHIVLHSA